MVHDGSCSTKTSERERITRGGWRGTESGEGPLESADRQLPSQAPEELENLPKIPTEWRRGLRPRNLFPKPAPSLAPFQVGPNV